MAIVRDIDPWDALLDAGRADERLVREERQNQRFPELAALPHELHDDVADALRARGVDSLWSHQVDAFEAAYESTTIVTTGTASGKSLCFQLPTLDVLSRDARARALFLYPSKALAQDQARVAARARRQARATGDLRRRHAARAARRRPPRGPT